MSIVLSRDLFDHDHSNNLGIGITTFVSVVIIFGSFILAIWLSGSTGFIPVIFSFWSYISSLWAYSITFIF